MISVVIPVYNVKPYLKQCIDSVINQTYRELEIIIIDDGSTDGSGDICDEYGLLDDRIIVKHQENKGLSVARNCGLEKAKGEWVSFVDSDDWLESDMFETLIEVAQETGGDIVSCKPRMCYGKSCQNTKDSLQIITMSGRDAITQLLTQRIVRFEVWNKIWKRKLIANERFVAGQVSEDVHFDLSLFMKCKLFAHIEKTLYNYRVNRKGSTNSSFKINRLCVFDEFDKFIRERESSKDTEMTIVCATMGCSFAYRIYEEALRTGQPVEICKKLHKLFRKYYIKCGMGKMRTLKTRLVWMFFKHFPNATIKVRNYLLSR